MVGQVSPRQSGVQCPGAACAQPGTGCPVLAGGWQCPAAQCRACVQLRNVLAARKGNRCSCLCWQLLKSLSWDALGCCKEQCVNAIYHQAVPETRLRSPGGAALGVCRLPLWFCSLPHVIFPHPVPLRYTFVLAKFLLLLKLYHLWKVVAEQELAPKFLFYLDTI